MCEEREANSLASARGERSFVMVSLSNHRNSPGDVVTNPGPEHITKTPAYAGVFDFSCVL